jgi:hypothetical protein
MRELKTLSKVVPAASYVPSSSVSSLVSKFEVLPKHCQVSKYAKAENREERLFSRSPLPPLAGPCAGGLQALGDTCLRSRSLKFVAVDHRNPLQTSPLGALGV